MSDYSDRFNKLRYDAELVSEHLLKRYSRLAWHPLVSETPPNLARTAESAKEYVLQLWQLEDAVQTPMHAPVVLRALDVLWAKNEELQALGPSQHPVQLQQKWSYVVVEAELLAAWTLRSNEEDSRKHGNAAEEELRRVSELFGIDSDVLRLQAAVATITLMRSREAVARNETDPARAADKLLTAAGLLAERQRDLRVFRVDNRSTFTGYDAWMSAVLEETCLDVAELTGQERYREQAGIFGAQAQAALKAMEEESGQLDHISRLVLGTAQAALPAPGQPRLYADMADRLLDRRLVQPELRSYYGSKTRALRRIQSGDVNAMLANVYRDLETPGSLTRDVLMTSDPSVSFALQAAAQRIPNEQRPLKRAIGSLLSVAPPNPLRVPR